MIIHIDINAKVMGEKLPNWDLLSNAIMTRMPQLFSFGILGQTCEIWAELEEEEEKQFSEAQV